VFEINYGGKFDRAYGVISSGDEMVVHPKVLIRIVLLFISLILLWNNMGTIRET
jgi:hypothetical protein